jgi:hypothetical protein
MGFLPAAIQRRICQEPAGKGLFGFWTFCDLASGKPKTTFLVRIFAAFGVSCVGLPKSDGREMGKLSLAAAGTDSAATPPACMMTMA